MDSSKLDSGIADFMRAELAQLGRLGETGRTRIFERAGG